MSIQTRKFASHRPLPLQNIGVSYTGSTVDSGRTYPPAPSGDAQPESVLRVGRTHVDKSVYYGGLFFR